MENYHNSLKGKVIFVSEARGRVAERIVQRLLMAGAIVLVSSRKMADLYKLRSSLKNDNALESRNLCLLPFDLNESRDAQNAKELIVKYWGGLDGFVGTCGLDSTKSSLLESGEAEWDEVINHQTKSHFLMAKNFMPLLSKRDVSVYVTISKNIAANPLAANGLSEASIAIRLMLTRSLSLETIGNPSVHCLLLTEGVPDGETDDYHITEFNIGEAVTTLMEHAKWVRGKEEFGDDWRERMQPPEEGLCMSGI